MTAQGNPHEAIFFNLREVAGAAVAAASAAAAGPSSSRGASSKASSSSSSAAAAAAAAASAAEDDILDRARILTADHVAPKAAHSLRVGLDGTPSRSLLEMAAALVCPLRQLDSALARLRRARKPAPGTRGGAPAASGAAYSAAPEAVANVLRQLARGALSGGRYPRTLLEDEAAAAAACVRERNPRLWMALQVRSLEGGGLRVWCLSHSQLDSGSRHSRFAQPLRVDMQTGRREIGGGIFESLFHSHLPLQVRIGEQTCAAALEAWACDLDRVEAALGRALERGTEWRRALR